MTPVDPAREIRELIAAHIAGELSIAQRLQLNELLRTDEKARADFVAAMRQDVLLGEVLREEVSRGEVKAGSAPRSAEIQRPTSGDEEPPTRRKTRPFGVHPSVAPWMGLLAAAAILIAVTIFFGLGPPGAGRPTSQNMAELRSRSLRDAEGRRLADREKALALAEGKHREAIERLRELDKKSQELSQSLTPSDQNSPEEDRRKKKRVELQGEKERVEQVERELREAIELAKTTGRPVPVESAPEEKASLPQGSPGVKQELTTQVAVARVEEAAGQAFLVTKQGKTPVTPGWNLLPMQGLETGGGASRLVIRFPDKTWVELGPATELGEIKTESGKRLWVVKGTLQAQILPQPKDQPMIFATPHGEAKVLGTTLRFTVDPDSKKGTRLEVDEGKVEFKNGAGKTVLVESGHYAVAAEGADLVARKEDASTAVPRSGLAVWLRADQGVILSGSGGVASWADRSGNKRDAVQLVPAQQPKLISKAVQGHPALRFDGVDDCMTFPCPVTGLTGMTIFLVSSTLEERGAANYGANAALYWQETGTCSGVLLNSSQSKVWWYFGTGQVQPLFVYPRPTALDQGFSLTTAQKSGPEVILFVNGQETFRIRGQGPAIGANEKIAQIGRGEGDLVTNRLFQGQREGWTYFCGEIAEILVYTRTLGESERRSVEQYLLGKYFLK